MNIRMLLRHTLPMLQIGDNRINNTTGEINNDASKLIANLFAWITDVVLYGE